MINLPGKNERGRVWGGVGEHVLIKAEDALALLTKSYPGQRVRRTPMVSAQGGLSVDRTVFNSDLLNVCSVLPNADLTLAFSC